MLSTVHPANDVRIVKKEAVTLTSRFDDVWVIGNAPQLEEASSICYCLHGLGRLSRWLRPFLGNISAIKYVRSIKPDLVHFHDPELIPAAILLKFFGYKIIYDIHEDTPEDIKSKIWIPLSLRPVFSYLLSKIEGFAAHFFDAIVTATPEIAQRLQSRKVRPTVIRNFASLSEFPPKSNNRQPSNKALYVGRISFNRGLREMTEACQKIGLTLVLAGPANSAEVEWIKAHSESIVWKGVVNRQEIAHLMSESLVGLCVLHHEPNYLHALPIKLFEYMAAELPVIVTDLPITKDIVLTADCGLVIPEKNTAALITALSAIIDDPIQSSSWGKKGRDAVIEKYNWEAESRKLIALYETLLHC